MPYTVHYLPNRALELAAQDKGITLTEFLPAADLETFFVNEGPFLTFTRAKNAAMIMVPLAFQREAFITDDTKQKWCVTIFGVTKVSHA